VDHSTVSARGQVSADRGPGRDASAWRRRASASAFLARLTGHEGLSGFAREVGEALDVTLVDIWSVDHERRGLVYEAVWQREGRRSDEHEAVGRWVALDQRPDLRALLDRGALVERHIDDPELPPELLAFMKRRGYHATLDAPLLIAGDVIGVLGIVETRPGRRFGKADLEFVGHVCQLAALGVQSAWAQRTEEERAEHLSTMLDSSHRLTASLDQWTSLAGMRSAIGGLLGPLEHTIDVYVCGEGGRFVPLDEQLDAGGGEASTEGEDGERSAVGPAPPADHDAVGSVGAVAGEPADPAHDLALRALERRRPAQARTGGRPTRLVVPLSVGGEACGYVDVRGAPLRRFTASEVSMLQVLGNHLAVAIEYARLGRTTERHAAVDTVTGFFNRWYFYERLYSETARADRYKQPLSILLVGIDGYERFLAERGQRDGDAVLKAISRLLMASLRRKVDVACRHGVGEFGLLLPNTPPFKPGAALVGERLRAAIEGMELRNEDHELLGAFTLSVGIAGFPRHAEDADELGGYAIAALKQARSLGGNRLQVHGASPNAFQPGEPDEEEGPDGEAAGGDSLGAIILPPDWDDEGDEDDAGG
jgi:diguanylate cyclase (GGDEF)-like protein